MILRYVRIEKIDAFERAGWFWNWRGADGRWRADLGRLPGPHGVWSVAMEWLCCCQPGSPDAGARP